MRTTREGLRLDVARRLRRDDGLARLAQLFVERGPPTFLRSANGPAGTATAVRDWLHRVGGTTRFIEPGRPWANGDGESFNGTLRDACRKRERFATLREAPILIAGWRREDNPDPPPPCPRLPPPRPGNAATPENVPCRSSRRSDSLNDWYNDRGQVSWASWSSCELQVGLTPLAESQCDRRHVIEIDELIDVTHEIGRHTLNALISKEHAAPSCHEHGTDFD